MTTGLIKTTTEKEEPILMPEEYKKLLKELYLIRSYSGFEEPLRRGIMSFLKRLEIPFINFNGNILGFNHPGAPLFSAHMDMVNTDKWKLRGEEFSLDKNHVFTLDTKTNIRLYRDKEKKQQTSLGADDKNGIWAILVLLQMGKQINFAFCHSEEVGGTGSKQIIDDRDCEKFIRSCKYGVVIDRRGANDIIGYFNKYCMVLDDKLEKFAVEQGFKFKTERGLVSDADRFSDIIECVNISCGYYLPHTSEEYTNLNELWNTLIFCEKMIDEFNYETVSQSRMKEFKGIKKEIVTTTYSSTKNNTVNYYDKWYKKDEEKVETTEKKSSEKYDDEDDYYYGPYGYGSRYYD